MKRALTLLVMLIAITVASSHAQAATRPVSLSWSASTSSSVTGYNISRCQVPTGALTCTPSGPALNTTPVVLTGFVDPAVTTGFSYVYGVVAIAPACTPTTPVNTACGQSVMVLSGVAPVPPTPAGGGTVIVVIP